MNAAAAAIAIAAFMALLHVTRVPARARQGMLDLRRALADLRDPDLDDDAKERSMQAHARRSFVHLLAILAGTVIALGVPAGALWLLDRAGVVDFAAAIEAASSTEFLVGGVILAVVAVAVLAWRRRA